MFTQCPDCGTVFRVSAQALRTAQGQVRCGICSSSFNALDALSEQPVPQHGDEPAQDDTITVEELPGNEVIELSGTYEQPPEDPGQEGDEQAGGDEEDHPAAGRPDPEEDRPGRDEETTDTELEFHGSAEDLERLFVAVDSPLRPGLTAAGNSRIAEFETAVERIASSDLSGIDVDEQELPGHRDEGPVDPAGVAAILAFRPRAEGDDESPAVGTSTPAQAAEAAGDDSPAKTGDHGLLEDDDLGDLERTDEFPILVLDEKDEALDSDGTSTAVRAPAGESPSILIPLELRRDAALAAEDVFSAARDADDEEGPRRWPWAVVMVLLALALGAQAVHHWRSELVASPVAGPWLLRIYGALGLELAVPTDLDAFELRQLGAASDPIQSGRLRLRASIVNLATFAQPYPLLRLSLQDRFGSTIGVRNLEPAEYLPGGVAPPSGLMAAGQRVDAEVVFVDPGRDAVGYELDVCMRQRGSVLCGSERSGSQP